MILPITVHYIGASTWYGTACGRSCKPYRHLRHVDDWALVTCRRCLDHHRKWPGS